VGRGFDLEIHVPFDHSFDEALQKSADECVAACPTAAIAFRNKEDVEACHTTT
jgi:Fe-S-cluster-containing dehydrogenase component